MPLLCYVHFLRLWALGVPFYAPFCLLFVLSNSCLFFYCITRPQTRHGQFLLFFFLDLDFTHFENKRVASSVTRPSINEVGFLIPTGLPYFVLLPPIDREWMFFEWACVSVCSEMPRNRRRWKLKITPGGGLSGKEGGGVCFTFFPLLTR